jgi:hypothetical protein
MKTQQASWAGLVLAANFLLHCSTIQAATSINATNNYAYGANIGWMDWRGDTNRGAVIGEYVCSGYFWGADVGWIHLGSNAPANGIQYQNNSAIDYGVNHDGLGNLRGYAYGANIGWINFELNGNPRVDLKTGQLSGHAWSANCGWISLSNAFAKVQTESLPGIDIDGDGIADAWERTYTNTLTAFTASSDTDGDGVSDKNEYLADTDPRNASDFLRITSVSRGLPMPTSIVLTWTSRPTRCYAVQDRATLSFPGWTENVGVLPSPGTNNAFFDDVRSQAYYRIRAFRPLTPP